MKSTRLTIFSGGSSASSSQSGLPACRPEPAQCAFPGQPPVQRPEVGQGLLRAEPGDERLQRVDRLQLDIVPAADREREAVATQRGPAVGRVGRVRACG